MKVTVLSGGTGTPKLIQGLKGIIPQKDISVIVNTGEDTWIGDLYLSPDVDTVLYTFADLINEETWYGVRGDTFYCHEQLKKLGFDEVLRIGDKDRALKMHKTHFLKKNFKLSEVIDIERKALNIEAKIYPMTDDRVETKILAKENDGKILLKFHDFWIKRRGNVDVVDVIYENAQYAKGCEGALKSIKESDFVLIGPSNPITSIGPILSIKDIKKALKDKFVVVVSPIVGDKVVSGPAGTLMKAKGLSVDVLGVYEFYKDILDVMVIDEIDADKADKIKCETLVTNTIMKTLNDKINLAKAILEFIRK
ncbi:2-phospho-L-lactate transferase [Methanotorris formicicus]|uniref:2-phospho-L-lactate transferase n=1 Tax=Methanotorris formicicus Mc-S-70 TaxID=647171 RepID=H1L008_9EURY|nr:2-phospho-L-lactate transferase [Methanotorris formicicus]EHP85306.1 LPPG domain protein containing protein [Methanotorris formicicus Mc-S-70]